MLTPPLKALRLLIAAALTAASLFVIVATPASADENCQLEQVRNKDGDLVWVEVCEDSGGDDGDDGGSGGGEQQCDLSIFDDVHDGALRWCEGETACWGNFPSVLPEDRWEEYGGGPAPSPDHIVNYIKCVPGAENGEWKWALPPEDTGPSLWDLAWTAHGSLTLPAFELSFSPPTTSLVYLDTWYWADGPSTDAIVGESGGSVIAIAEPRNIEVDPGDGSATLTCEFEVAENDRCIHAYTQASIEHPDGYPARMRLVYDVRFENDGAPLELDGLPTTLTSPWEQAALPVSEVQTLVTR